MVATNIADEGVVGATLLPMLAPRDLALMIVLALRRDAAGFPRGRQVRFLFVAVWCFKCSRSILLQKVAVVVGIATFRLLNVSCTLHPGRQRSFTMLLCCRSTLFFSSSNACFLHGFSPRRSVVRFFCVCVCVGRLEQFGS